MILIFTIKTWRLREGKSSQVTGKLRARAIGLQDLDPFLHYTTSLHFFWARI